MTFLPLLFLLSADVAIRDDGQRFEGELRLSKPGQLVFTPKKREAVVKDIVEYRFTVTPGPFREAPAMLLTLPNNQRISGVLLGIDKDKVRFRTAWCEQLDISRKAVGSVAHLPGRRTVFHDDLAGKLSAWTVKGEPKREKGLLILNKPGQSLTYTLARPMNEGRVGINLQELDSPSGAQWTIETVFVQKKVERVIRVSLGKDRSISVTADGLKGTLRDVPRSKTIRRLFLDFSTGSLRITVDDDALWYTFDSGPGALRSVRLMVADLDKPEKVTGAVAFSHVCIERTVAEARHPAGDPKQDELWLGDGDQLFGTITSASTRTVEIMGRFGTKRYDWTELRGVFLRLGEKPPAVKSPAVRLGIRSGLRAEEDVLEGTLTSLEAKSITIRHPILGERTLPRERIAWIRPLAR